MIDRGEADGRQFIVFEYVDGKNLKQLVQSRAGCPSGTRSSSAIEIGRALAFAHAQGLVHRDVKPQNVLLGDGDVKVTDFGIARSLDVNVGLTQTGHGAGDERLHLARAGERPARSTRAPTSTRSASCSTSCSPATPPYSGDSFVAVAMQHVSDPPPSIALARPDVPLRVDAALRARDGEGSRRPLPVDGRFRLRARGCLARSPSPTPSAP